MQYVQKNQPGTPVCFISLLLEVLSFSLLFFLKTQSLLTWKYLCVYKRTGDFCELFYETFFPYITAFSHIFLCGAEWPCFSLSPSVGKSMGTLHGMAHDNFLVLKDLGGNDTNFISEDEVIRLHLKPLSVWLLEGEVPWLARLQSVWWHIRWPWLNLQFALQKFALRFGLSHFAFWNFIFFSQCFLSVSPRFYEY